MLVSFQIDHPDSLNYRTDSTLPIILESQKRGFKNYVFQPHNVFMNNKGIFASVSYTHLTLPTKA